MQTIVETEEFLARSKKLLEEEEREHIIATVAKNPTSGDLIVGTGGFRKLRIKKQKTGKSGGYRVIYYYYNKETPIFLLSVYAKTKTETITPAQKNVLKKLSDILAKEYKHGGNHG